MCLKNLRDRMSPIIATVVSVAGYVSQKYTRPSLEKRYASGTNRETVRMTVSIELVMVLPTA